MSADDLHKIVSLILFLKAEAFDKYSWMQIKELAKEVTKESIK